MSRLPEAAPLPDKPPVHIQGGNLLVASPLDITEACFCVPAVRALRNARPHASLAVLTPASLAPLWRTVAGINRLVEFDDDASIKEITREILESTPEPETAIAWEDSPAVRALEKAGVRQRLGYDTKPLAKRLTDPIDLVPPSGPVEHRVRFYLTLLEQLGVECYLPKNFEPPPLPPRPSPMRIGLVPGSTFGPAYRWDLERFRELGAALLASYPVELFLLAFPGHASEANELDRRFEGRVKNYGNEFDLAGLLHALPHLSFLISNDGAVTHLAAHLGVPTVALCGPGDPVAARPLGRQHIVLSQYVECSPCNRPACPLGHHRCLEELTVARVFGAANAFLRLPPQD